MIGTYERIATSLLKGMPPPARWAKAVDGRLLCGIKSQHRTPQGRSWRLFWRLKYNRQV